ncbi:MAG TPA: adenylate/guanylate cyclase domain-containing protein [Allosphingosinicella sp.]|nr:adenylate/guanylate cyclase domain-containing protein [Allosphingosinicella sp.]
MSLSEDLHAEVRDIFKYEWTSRDGLVVPEPSDLKLGNDAVSFDRATILYADLNGSTRLVDTMKWWFAAEVYKSYLHCAARLVRNEGGVITSYDGDRVMGVFIGASQTSDAARCALKINYAVQSILNPALRAQYPKDDTVVRQVVGIDTSPIRAARTGVRGDNDLVWVGRAANYAAKLTNIDAGEQTWITEAAYGRLNANSKFGGNPRVDMWSRFNWTEHDDSVIYGSSWAWSI